MRLGIIVDRDCRLASFGLRESCFGREALATIRPMNGEVAQNEAPRAVPQWVAPTTCCRCCAAIGGPALRYATFPKRVPRMPSAHRQRVVGATPWIIVILLGLAGSTAWAEDV